MGMRPFRSSELGDSFPPPPAPAKLPVGLRNVDCKRLACLRAILGKKAKLTKTQPREEGEGKTMGRRQGERREGGRRVAGPGPGPTGGAWATGGARVDGEWAGPGLEPTGGAWADVWGLCPRVGLGPTGGSGCD